MPLTSEAGSGMNPETYAFSMARPAVATGVFECVRVCVFLVRERHVRVCVFLSLSLSLSLSLRARVCLCVCVCVHAGVRACVCLCLCVSSNIAARFSFFLGKKPREVKDSVMFYPFKFTS